MIEGEGKDDFKCLDLSNWKNGVAIDKTGKTAERIGSGKRSRDWF